MKGYFQGKIKYRGQEAQSKVYVSAKEDNILGWPVQKDLGVYFDPNACPQIQVKSVQEYIDYVSKFPDVICEKLG